MPLSPVGGGPRVPPAPPDNIEARKAAKKAARKENCERAKQVFLTPDLCTGINSSGGLSRSLVGTIRHFHPVPTNVRNAFGGTQLGNCLTMPHSVWSLIGGFMGLAKDKSPDAVLDNALGVIGDAGEIADQIGTIASGLMDIGAVPVMQWAGILSLVGTCVQAAFIPIFSRGIHYAIKCTKELEVAEKKGLEEVKAFVKKREYFLSRQCGVDTKLFTKTINNLKDPDSLPKACEALKERIKFKKVAHSLGIIMTAIVIIATVVLFATSLTPFGILGAVLLTATFAFSLTKLTVEIIANKRFKKKMLALQGPTPKLEFVSDDVKNNRDVVKNALKTREKNPVSDPSLVPA